MTDHTIPGIIGIVAIVLVVAAFMSLPAQTSSEDVQLRGDTLAGQATQPQLQSPDVVSSACEAKRYCDGTKLTIIQSDCSVNYAHCQYGCSSGACI
ncbi:MAG: hypothetical protein ACMXYD_03985 [Candidatus Woesearchaeota archaeon]